MSRVFSWDDVRDKRIPSLDAFPRVLKVLRENLPSVPGFCGAIACGSVLWNAHSSQSDLDCFIVYDEEQREDCMVALHQLSCRAAVDFVPLEFIPLDREVARTPLHHIDSMFYGHLHTAAQHGGIIGKNPLKEMTTEQRQPMRRDLEDYLRYKLREYEHACARVFPDEEDRIRFLGKVLSDPIHVARRLLQWKGLLDGPGLRGQILDSYACCPSLPPIGLLRQIMNVGTDYTRHLATQQRSPDEGTYSAMLNRIEMHTPIAFQFIRNALFFMGDEHY